MPVKGSSLPDGAFDGIPDDAIWGTSTKEMSGGTSTAASRVDMITSRRSASKGDLSAASSPEEAEATHRQLFLLGSTFCSDIITVKYVSANLSHILGMKSISATLLAKRLKHDQGKEGISIGIMEREKCKAIEAQLQLRDIKCRSAPVSASDSSGGNSGAGT